MNVTGIITATSFDGNITGDITGNADTATKLETSRNFEITGDFITAPSIGFDGTDNVSLAATITTNSIGLGTYTSGDYVASISGTANQIAVDVTSGEGTTPVISIPNNPTLPGTTVTVETDLIVNRNLNVTGNITIGGTSATLFTETLKISDPDIIVGFRTDASGNDISNDTTASHGGIAIASTEGTPLITLVNPGAGETFPATYKKIMWFEQGSFTGLGTDAWLINYGVGIGSTQVPNNVVLAAGDVHVTNNDIKKVRDINSSGIVTATTFSGSGASLTSIPNGALTNSSIAIGGVTLNLGDTDATPAFDLSDATAYPYTSLTGITTEILGDTTPQLGGDLDLNSNNITGTGNVNITGVITATTFSGSGASLTSIPNGALTNSSIAIGGLTLNLGDTDATPAFDLSDATNYPYTSLTGISTEILYDTTPQLGGDLDLNSNNITGTGGINVSGIVTATTFSGSGASLTDIPNGALTNSSIAIGGVTLNLGDTDATPAFDPQLGGNLDLNSNDITGTGDVNITGIITATSFDGNITGDITGNADTATKLETSRNFEITGDVVASQISFDGTGNVSLAATIQPNSVALATDTTGDFVQSITGTANEVTVSVTSGENSTPQIGLPNDVTIGQDLTVTRNIDVDGHTELDDVNVSGVSTFTGATDFNGDVDIDGHTELDGVNVSETLSVSGLSTFSSNVDVNASVDISTNLTVDGLSDLDELNVSGVSTFGGNVNLGDDNRLRLGDSQDLEIYHDGSHSYIDDVGTGNLFLRSETLSIQNLAGNKTSALFQSGSGQELYFNNSKKFETVGGGVSVSSGTASTATIYGPGNLIIDPAPVDDNGGIVRIKGDLYVDGTTTEINSTTLTINDLNIVVASGSTNSTAADGAGITVDGASATLQYATSGDKWVFNKVPYYNSDRLLTTADEGSGNGIDADTLDGQEGTYYLDYANFSGIATDSDKLDGQQGTYYLNTSGTSQTKTGDLTINGNLGLGTSPSQKLDVNGAVRLRGAVYDNNNSTGTSSKVLKSTVTGVEWGTLADLGGISGVTIADDNSSTSVFNIAFTDSSGTSITEFGVSSSNLTYKPEGKLGIGTSNPSVALDVNGDLTVSGIITATTFSGSGASLTSIPNSALVNSSIAIGGVTLNLGDTDATPAFELPKS
jgi:cytoskeletal protein CcmA (bactofilin family)